MQQTLQQILDVFGYVHPFRLGQQWLTLIAALLGLGAGLALAYSFAEHFPRWKAGLIAASAAVLAFVLELLYRKYILSNEEPVNYDLSALQFKELALTLLIFLSAGMALEILARTTFASFLKGGK